MSHWVCSQVCWCCTAEHPFAYLFFFFFLRIALTDCFWLQSPWPGVIRKILLYIWISASVLRRRGSQTSHHLQRETESEGGVRVLWSQVWQVKSLWKHPRKDIMSQRSLITHRKFDVIVNYEVMGLHKWAEACTRKRIGEVLLWLKYLTTQEIHHKNSSSSWVWHA